MVRARLGIGLKAVVFPFRFLQSSEVNECGERQQIGIVPDQRPAPIDAPSISKKLRASFDLKEVCVPKA
jgi:hypothetical protein